MEQAGVVIAGILYLLPFCALVWKAATLSSRVTQNEKDIKDVKLLQAENNKAVLDALKQLNETMEKVRLDVELIKLQKQIEDRQKQMENKKNEQVQQ